MKKYGRNQIITNKVWAPGSSALKELTLHELKEGLAKDNRKREILLYSGPFLLRLVDIQEP